MFAEGVTLIVFVMSPVDHTYVSAPEAVSVAVSPSQTTSELTVTEGTGITVTVEVDEAVQPDVLPLTE